jgi:hypothetical protein
MGLLQFISLTIAAHADIPDAHIMALLLALMSFSGAFVDVVIDAMMVIQAKKYPETGSQELLSFSWMVGGFAAMIGGVTAACIL